MDLPGGFAAAGACQVHAITVEPAYRVLLTADGMTEGRCPGGTEFGLKRFTDFIIRAAAVGELASGELLPLTHAIVDHQESELRDDATIMLLEGRPSRSKPPSSRR